MRPGDIDGVVIVGMMSSMCVDATVRAAADAGYAVTVAHDACAAPDLEFGDTRPGRAGARRVHGGARRQLREVVSTDELLAGH